MRQNLVVFMADLFNVMEIHPAKCVRYPGMDKFSNGKEPDGVTIKVHYSVFCFFEYIVCIPVPLYFVVFFLFSLCCFVRFDLQQVNFCCTNNSTCLFWINCIEFVLDELFDNWILIKLVLGTLPYKTGHVTWKDFFYCTINFSVILKLWNYNSNIRTNWIGFKGRSVSESVPKGTLTALNPARRAQ